MSKQTDWAMVQDGLSLAPIGVLYLSPEAKLLWANAAYCAFLGYDSADLPGLGLIDVSHPDEVGLHFQTARRMLAGEISTASFDKRYRRKDGVFVWGSVSTTLIRDAAGIPTHFLTFIQDITLRKAAEEQAQELSLRLQVAVESANMQVWELNFSDMSVCVSTISSGGDLGFIPQNHAEFMAAVHVDDRDTHEAAMQHAIDTGGTLFSEFRVVTPTGDIKWMQTSARTLFDSAGRPLRMIGAARDITIKKRLKQEATAAHREVLEAARLLKLTVDNIPLLVAYLHTDLSYGFINRTYGQWFGPVGGLVQQGRLAEVFGAESAKTVEEHRKQSFAGSPSRFHLTIKRPDLGEDAVLDIQYLPHRSDDGSVQGLVILGEDLTEKIRSQKQIDAQRAQLVAAAKLASLGEMAGGIAHEINNPLAVIHGRTRQLCRALAKGSLEPQTLEHGLKTVIEMTDRIAKIIQSMRTFSRDGTQDPFQQASLQTIIADSVTLCVERFTSCGVNLTVLAAGEDAEITCRPVQVSQMLVNMLMNAFDAVEKLAEKWVCLEYKKVGQAAVVTITDSGPGIPEDVAARIFEPFYTTKAVGKGTGLGLSLTMAIAKDHGGALMLDRSVPNTRFTLSLPLTSAAKGAA